MSDRDKPSSVPDRETLLAFIQESGTVNKRDIARHFGIKGSDKIYLKQMLKELALEGVLAQDQARSFRPADSLPSVTVVMFDGLDNFGELLLAVPQVQLDEKPIIRLDKASRKHANMGPGDRALAKLHRVSDKKQIYRATIMKRLQSAPDSVLGIFRGGENGGRIVPTDKKAKHDLLVSIADMGDAQDGDLVLAEPVGKRGRQAYRHMARVREVLGDINAPKSISLIAIHEHGIPVDFPKEVIRAAETAADPGLKGRVDMRHIPLITIDPADARDHDDAVFAEQDTDPKNPGGWHAIVAIADVSHFVTPGSALDREAYRRGNSCYFPDRVVPMLPEALSNGLCSLKPHADRAALACHMWFDADGTKLRHKFERVLMRSHANIAYERVQAAIDGAPDAEAADLLDGVLKPLYGLYAALTDARERREPLNLELPERKIIMDDDGVVTSIDVRERLDAHKLVEEMMIAANVAAAEQLEAKQTPLLYRTHEEPPMAKLEALRDFLKGEDLNLAKGAVMMPRLFNQILRQVEGETRAPLINEVILRSQTQAYYGPEQVGHFGLALSRYAHFTSPIRRYADLIVHRALVKALKLGDGGLSEAEIKDLPKIGEHISDTERRAMSAERKSKDRYIASYLAQHVGDVFKARITGVTRFGLFLGLEPTGADALLPISALHGDYFEHDETHHRLIGKRTGLMYKLGDMLDVLLEEADKVTGGIKVVLADAPEGGTTRRTRMSRRPRSRTGEKSDKSPQKPGRSAKAAGKTARKPKTGGRKKPSRRR